MKYAIEGALFAFAAIIMFCMIGISTDLDSIRISLNAIAANLDAHR